jgi:hypothetical protein
MTKLGESNTPLVQFYPFEEDFESYYILEQTLGPSKAQKRRND